MAKHKLTTLGFCLLLTSMFFLALINIGKAQTTTITLTRTFSSLSYDGHLKYTSASYQGTWQAFRAQEIHQDHISIGQTPEYKICRGAVFFDTSILPDNCTITSATLSLRVYVNMSVHEFNVTVQNGKTTSFPHMPLTVIDYSQALYEENGGSTNSSEAIDLEYFNITLNTQGKSFIEKTATTKLFLRSNKDIEQIVPTQVEEIMFFASEAGEDYAPKLYVTYETEGYKYILHGPYYEDGTVPPSTNVSVTLYSRYNNSINFIMPNGTSTYTIETEQKANHFMWNISGSSYNVSRFYWLTNQTTEDIYIFIPKPSDIFDVYLLELSDFVGISNTYAETIIQVNGSDRVIERQPYTSNVIPFYLCFGHHYNVKLTCNKGTHVWEDVIPTTELTITMIITSDFWAATFQTVNATATATRQNNTWIQAYYLDSTLYTSNVTLTLIYYQGTTLTTENTTIVTGQNLFTVDWYDLNETQDYYVNITAYREATDETLQWFLPIPAPLATSNGWNFISILGIWPVPSQYIVGALIILSILAIFSTATIAGGCLLATLSAGFLNLVGWMNTSWSLITLAACLSFLYLFIEARKNERFGT